MADEIMLTTTDNPYNPFDDFNKWMRYDELKGYSTCEYLARVAKTSPLFTDEENEAERKRAIQEIIAADPFGIRIAIREGEKAPKTVNEISRKKSSRKRETA